MRSVPLWKWLTILAVALVSLLYLYPSLIWYRLPADIRNEANPQTERIREIDAEIAGIRSATSEADLDRIAELEEERQGLRDDLFALRDSAIPLGLDLAGGMHVVLEVEEATKTAKAAGATAGEGPQSYLDQALTVYRARVDKLGLTEPIVEKQPPNRILIQIPGIKNPEDVLKILRATAKLEFHLTAPQQELVRTWDKVVAANPALGERVTVAYPSVQVAERDIDSVSRAISAIKLDIPRGYEFFWGPVEVSKADTARKYRQLYLLDEDVEMGGETLTRAMVDFQSNFVTQPVVSLEFDREGTTQFARVTTEHVNESLAIVLDDVVYSAPNIDEPIRQGRAVIRGSFTTAEAQSLAVVLEAGALQTEVRIVENRSVGPSLGRDSIRQGLIACLYGFVAILIFMPAYYFLSGVFANIALILNVLMLSAALAMFHATLTLPGIAGIVLTIGMAVDANVLVFDRIREEIMARGSGLATTAVERGYGRALSAILDSNVTTLLTALVLMNFGTGPIKGFAVTLSVGILISLFTALFVTRVFQDKATIGKKNDQISIGPVEFLMRANFDFMKYGPFFVVFSVILLVSGFGYTVTHWSDMKGIELTGGSMVRLQFAEATPTATVREQLTRDLKLETFQLQQVGTEQREFIIRLKQGATIPADQEVVDIREGGADLVSRAGEGVIYTKPGEPEVDMANYVAVGLDKLNPDFPITLISMESFTPSFGAELAQEGIYAVIFSWFFILVYLGLRFQFAYGIAALVALIHDVFVALGALGISSQFGVIRELNLSTIAALLTVIGYSVNDTIVVFDRIRENRRGSKEPLGIIINRSINQSLSRTLITSLTTLLVIVILFFFGGDVINDFAFVLMVGIGVGTYSSIYVASYLLYVWQGRKETVRAVK
jgi:SecD/SecF fusion protein